MCINMNLVDILEEMGISATCIGNVKFSCLGLATSEPKKPMLSFVASERYLADLSTDVSCLIVPPSIVKKVPTDLGVCVYEYPRELFFAMHNYLADCPGYRRELAPTRIGKGCSISSLAYVAPQGVVIGNDVVIEEFVSIKENTTVGDGCVIRTGTVVGGEGFEVKRINNKTETVRHTGGVILGTNVEVQQNCCIDRALYPWDNTILADDTRLDNLVYIAHGVKLGHRVEVGALAMVTGRTVVGDDVWIGPSAAVRNGISIGSGARVNMGAVVTRPVPDGVAVSGNFAIEHDRFLRNVKLSAADDLIQALEDLRDKV